MLDVICVGSATRDVFFTTKAASVVKDKKFPSGKGVCLPLESKLDMESLEFFVGGGAVNTAITFARQGLNVAPVSAVGKDGGGEGIVRALKEEGVQTNLLQEHPRSQTSYVLILSAGSEGRTILRYSGAGNDMQDQIPWQEAKASWMYLNHLPENSAKLLPKFLSFAKENNTKIAWNPGTTQLEHPEELRKALPDIDVFIVNQEEAALVTGLPYQEKEEIFEKLDEWVKGIVVMTKGPEGVEVSDGKTRWSANILPLDKVVDRTGAGDAFGAAFVASLIKNPGEIEQAIQFASANATSVLTEWGANKGLLSGFSFGPFAKIQVDTLTL